jgi:predicted P-loop ATPase
VREWLTSLRRDGYQRIGWCLSDCLGVERDTYGPGVGRTFLISMGTRVMRPDLQADYMLEVFEAARIPPTRASLAHGNHATDEDHRGA